MRKKQNAYVQGIAFIISTMLFAYTSRIVAEIFGINVADEVSQHSFEKTLILIISWGILYGFLYLFSYFFICTLFKYLQSLAKKR